MNSARHPPVAYRLLIVAAAIALCATAPLGSTGAVLADNDESTRIHARG
jgi:hypothetical protein